MGSSDQKHTPITKEDLESLAGKMEVFAASLSPAERGLLGLALSNGARYVQTPFAHGILEPTCQLTGTRDELCTEQFDRVG